MVFLLIDIDLERMYCLPRPRMHNSGLVDRCWSKKSCLQCWIPRRGVVSLFYLWRLQFAHWRELEIWKWEPVTSHALYKGKTLRGEML